MNNRKIAIIGVIIILLILPLIFSVADIYAGETAQTHDMGSELPLWSAIPFAGILLSIAVFHQAHQL